VSARVPSLRPRSLQTRLALLFVGVAALAFSIIFFYVVPQLRSELEAQEMRDLALAVAASETTLQSALVGEIAARDLDELVRSVADNAEADVTLLSVRDRSGGGDEAAFTVLSDSRAGRQINENFELARQAARTRRVQTLLSPSAVASVGQAAQPILYSGQANWVALYSRSLADVGQTVRLIRNQVAVATSIALLVAMLGGYAIARMLARRVRRLEEAARRVASGESVEPLPVDAEDELGRLTRTFNEMQAQLAQLDTARRDFIATASHELRTPIFSLGGFIELLQDEEIDPNTREEFLTAMRGQVERLQKLAVDLLDLSRLDAGSLQLQRETVDIGDLARAIVGEFMPAVSNHRTALDLRLPPGEVEAFCDRERVAQIMRILLDNALRHTPEGTSVAVTAAHRNGTAEFTVADAGPGLEREAIDQLFERFYTADGARGSGLGLAIAKELAERMRGRIEVASRPGATAFTLALPGEQERP